jgi:hypothetical protein
MGWGATFHGRAALLRSRVSGAAPAPPHRVVREVRRQRNQIENREWKDGIFATRTNTFKSPSNWWTLLFSSQQRLPLARFEHFCGKSTQLPFHEYVTHNNDFFRSSPVKANQA